MALIFLNYRRSDTQSLAQRVASRLKTEFGESQVFIDVDDMQIGVWSEQLRQQIQTCRVFLVLIGNKWLKAQNEESAQRRLDEESDAVRNEIEIAIKQQKLVIIVLVGDAILPSKAVLPISIQNLPDFQYVKVREDDARTFDNDLTSLIDKISKSATENPDSHEERLVQLGLDFISSRSDLERYNIARRTLNAFIYNNSNVNGDTIRLIEAHVSLTIAYYLKKLKSDWRVGLADQVRRVAIDNTLELIDPLEPGELSDFAVRALSLDTDPPLREALENGLSYALPLNKVPAQLLRFGINIAFSSSVLVANRLRVLEQELPQAIKDTSEESILSALTSVEDRLRKQWFLK